MIDVLWFWGVCWGLMDDFCVLGGIMDGCLVFGGIMDCFWVVVFGIRDCLWLRDLFFFLVIFVFILIL